MKSWVKFGLIWGIVMFVILNILFPLYDGEKLNLQKLSIFFPVWLIFGILFGYISQGKKKKIDKQI